MPHVLLGIPHGGTIKAKLLSTVVSVIAQAPCPITLVESESALGPHNRNTLAQCAVDRGFSHLWLVDNDMTFPPDTLARLLAHKKDIVGAAYNYRQFPRRTVVKMVDEEGRVMIPETLPPTIFPCYAIGSGCKLITVEALRKIQRPWFWLRCDDEGQLITSDDVWFCEQAIAVGIETYCDPTIDAKHIGDCQY